MSIHIRWELQKHITYITLEHVSYEHRSHTYLLTCAKQLSAKGLLAEICPIAITVLMHVNQVDTVFEYAVIFVCWIIFRVNQQNRERNCYMIMLLNIVMDH